MLYTTLTLSKKYEGYKNFNQKVANECKKGNLVRIKKGLYTDDLYKDIPLIANFCYSPSYISFEYALFYYGLTPEYVSLITSATFNKKNSKEYKVKNISFEYNSIPNDAFPYGIEYFKVNDTRYKMASKEKALCDVLYAKYPVRSIKDLKNLLFEDLRVDEDEFMNLDFDFIIFIADKYHSNTLSTLKKYVEGLKNERCN